jgi:hypothetical protein
VRNGHLGWRAWGLCTSVVLDADVDSRIEMLRGDVYGLLAVDVHILVFGRIVRRTGGDAEYVILVVLHSSIDALLWTRR